MKPYLYFPLIVLTLTACTHRQKNSIESELETIVIDIDKMETQGDATFMIDTAQIEVIALETNDDCLIANIEKIYLQNNKIIVYDDLTHGAYIFNRDGSYHAKVHAIGNGPGEYPPHINDVFVSKQYIGILSPMKAGIMLFDFDGQYVKDIPLQGAWGKDFFTFDDKIYFIVSNWYETDLGYYNLFILNPNTKKLQTLFPFSKDNVKNKRGWGLDQHYSLSRDRALIIYSTINTIYSITLTGEVTSQYAIDIVKNKLPDHFRTGDGYTAIYSSIDNNYIMGVKSIIETSRFLYLTIDGWFHVVYDKIEKQVKLTTGQLWLPSWDFGFDRIHRSSDNEDEILLGWQAAYAYESKENKDPYYLELQRRSDRFARAYLSVLDKLENEDDNPIVVIMKVKK